ncbi:MAG: glycerol-3-phosphate 1-O-acyltransferase PlsY [Lachnospiraceae bacterium]|nr:glycerol-3-phosphate 1-O-acyltransferase PlsY [Lachnospiraceae bacterium]
MERAICLLIGYACGLFQTGYFLSTLHGVNLREKGSGNFGATNTLRVMGNKFGILVLIGDVLKAVLACLIVKLVCSHIFADFNILHVFYAGFGAVLGHDFPFYLKFKGGKGVASTAGMVLGMGAYKELLIGLALFVLIVAITRYVSLGSCLSVALGCALLIVKAAGGAYGLTTAGLAEFSVIGLAAVLLCCWKHRSNIKRLIAGTENKFGTKVK